MGKNIWSIIYFLIKPHYKLLRLEKKNKKKKHESMFCFVLFFHVNKLIFLRWKNGGLYANTGSLACLSAWRLICIWVFLASKSSCKSSIYWEEQKAIHVRHFSIFRKEMSGNMRQKCIFLFLSFLTEWEKKKSRWHRAVKKLVFWELLIYWSGRLCFMKAVSQMHVTISAIFGTLPFMFL